MYVLVASRRVRCARLRTCSATTSAQMEVNQGPVDRGVIWGGGGGGGGGVGGRTENQITPRPQGRL